MTMNNYTELVKQVLDEGIYKNVRTEERCLTISHEMLSFDMRDGFPLLTQRFIPFKSVCVELEGFLKGITSKEWYEKNGCIFWRKWANPKEVDKMQQDHNTYSRRELQERCDDLGTFYAWQWRHFNGEYDYWQPDVTDAMGGVDQIQGILNTLKDNSNDRRMVCTALNPSQEDTMALPPCHYSFGLTRIGEYLDLAFIMRSSDVYLGLPSNIASYAILLHLFAKHAGLTARKLTYFGMDIHLYENHLDQAKTLLNRDSHPLPTIEFSHDNFWDWDHTKIKLVNYNHSGKLSAPVAV